MDKPPIHFRGGVEGLPDDTFMVVNEERLGQILGEEGVTFEDLFAAVGDNPTLSKRIYKALKRAADEKIAVLVKNVKVD